MVSSNGHKNSPQCTSRESIPGEWYAEGDTSKLKPQVAVTPAHSPVGEDIFMLIW